MGTGRVAHEFVQAVQYVADAELYAVASRTQQTADAFGAAHGATRAYGSYEAMLADPAVDVVYVATPTHRHEADVMACFQAGKAVLCEKAITPSREAFDRLVAEATRRQCFLMEAVWMQFHPAFRQMLQWIHEGRIGRVRCIKAELGWLHPYDPLDRIFAKALGAGTLLDLGVYTLGMACSVLGFQPDEVAAVASFGPDGADLDSHVQLRYPNAYAALTMGYTFDTTGETVIAGEKGRIVFTERFHDAWRVRLEDAAMTSVETFAQPYACNGYEQEIEAVHDALRRGALQDKTVSWAYTGAVLALLDRCQAQFDEQWAALQARNR